MGHILVKSPIGGDLYTMATRWLSWLPGGLAIASIGACTVFGAVSGVSVAGTPAMPIHPAFPLSSTERSPMS
jgi:TRAP-type C4-dicarboxylate transport system permease large subunit